jgi:hypothetical protein
MAPALGYADASSARLMANAQPPAPPIIQLHIMAAAPPARHERAVDPPDAHGKAEAGPGGELAFEDLGISTT